MILLVVDTQKGITDDRLHCFDLLEKNIKTLIEEARKNGVEVVYVRHDDGAGSGFSYGDDDFEIYEGFAPAPGEKIFDKKVNNAFNSDTGLDDYLMTKGVEKVIVTGLQTDFCIDATIKGGFDLGFKMTVPAYCNSTRSNPYADAQTMYKFYNEFMWPGRYADCVTVEDAVSMIREYRKDPDDAAGINAVGPETIETERLVLRAFERDDADSMMRNWVSDEYVQGMYGEPAYKTREEVDRLLDKYILGCQSGYSFRWAVIEKESGECIGLAAYFLVDAHNMFGEIEYCIGTAFQGKGYATEATRALIDFGFDRIGFNKVQICVRPSNLPSKRVIEKCGFRQDGNLREYFRRDGHFEDRYYFSILKDERD